MDPISIVFTLAMQNPDTMLDAVDRIPDRKRGPWYIDRKQHGDDFYLFCGVEESLGV